MCSAVEIKDFLVFILGVAQTNRLVYFSALPWRFQLDIESSTSCWSYRGRNRIRNYVLFTNELQINAYSESAPQDMWKYYWMLEIERENARFKQFIVKAS